MTAFVLILIVLFVLGFVIPVLAAIGDSRRHRAVVRRWIWVFLCVSLLALVGLDHLTGKQMPEWSFAVLFGCVALFALAAALFVRKKIGGELARELRATENSDAGE